MKTSADLFSGAGGVACGAKQAGYEHAWGLEYSPAIAEIYRENIGQVFVQDILESNPYKFEKVDLLHASPVCFPLDTLILTNKGLIPIQDIQIGDFAVTHKGRLKKVVNTLSRVASVLELKGQGHYGLVATHDHPFLSIERKVVYPAHKERKAGNWCHSVLTEPQWVNASELKGKHWLSLTQYPSMPIPKIIYLGNEGLRGQTFEFSPAFFKFVGLWVGNGWIRYSDGIGNKKNRGEVTICCNKKKVDAMRQDFKAAGIKFYETTKYCVNSIGFCDHESLTNSLKLSSVVALFHKLL